ncbi:AAA family ATPase [Niallia sp.]|uniref:AAA family ATPase n=1 Tax=Niallia sp. TaxID=2837523 RepID=UPI0028A01A68|nr:AAA family ATPase [Niallia sp.]
MKKSIENKVYILSGPAGVGKSTTSKELTKNLAQSAYISGDYISHMHINGRKKPWERREEVTLIWDNILSLTKNFLRYGNDVVVDYVSFPQEVRWLKENLKGLNVEVIYAVLWTDIETLIKRDKMRDPENRMGERCLILFDEFLESELEEKHFLDTGKNSTEDIPNVINEMINNPKYKII